jgi:transcriptional regulator with XRE-family HTH domain
VAKGRVDVEDADLNLDLDRLAMYLRNKMEEEGLSIRTAAPKIGCSPATLARLLQGSKTENVPDSVNLMRAASWVGKRLGDFEIGKQKPTSTLGDVEVHLRALPGLSKADAEGLVAMVKAAYDAAAKLRAKKGSGR